MFKEVFVYTVHIQVRVCEEFSFEVYALRSWILIKFRRASVGYVGECMVYIALHSPHFFPVSRHWGTVG